MNTKAKLVFIFLLVIGSANAQQNPHSLTFDLSERTGSEGTPLKEPGKEMRVEVVYLKNAFPKRVYSLTVNEKTRLLDPLRTGGKESSKSEKCPELQEAYDTAYNFANRENPTKTEKELKAKLDMLDEAVKTFKCADISLLTDIEELKKNCTRAIMLPIPIEMASSKDYTFKISTYGDRAFEYVFEGHDRGQWVMNYGFLFSPSILEPRRYFSDQLGTDSFRITKRELNSVMDLRFTPTIFFSYFLDKRLSKDWNNSLSLGLGFNTASPVVSIGYNGMWNQNIGFSTGFVFYEQSRLDSRFHAGQIIKENLDEDKLYEKSFRPNLFLALNIRLGENPFKKEEAK